MDERANLGRRDDPVDNEARLYVSGPGESYDDDLAASAPAAPPEGDQQPEELRGEAAPAERWNPAAHGQSETGRF